MSQKNRTRSKHRRKYWSEHDKDNYECPMCEATIDDGVRFEVHHKDEHHKNGQMENLVALCQDCHRKEHGMQPGKKRGHWSEQYFHEWRSNESPMKYL